MDKEKNMMWCEECSTGKAPINFVIICLECQDKAFKESYEAGKEEGIRLTEEKYNH